ncbi:mitochondrial inner membrane protease ATP23 homolog isoform X2 [Vespa mandarinia]|uniref:mitochondrial inner membrane protease ATP23 homolog isoform X2 n=2 Tax=Vespa mandarinia TaxID=7446 RepID=UPI00162241F2|nr:mitochondrial inner membrane protease ATP23 homolog isoform X2 [Vespa mandarinia]
MDHKIMTVFSFNNEKIKENLLDNKVDEQKENKINDKNQNKKFDKNASTIDSSVDDANWGYDLYPERRGRYKPTFFRKLIGEGKEEITRLKCEGNVYKCIKNSQLVQLMMAALKSSGCEIDMRRHISCEICDYSVKGGYDAQLNQIVVCQNTAHSESKVQGVLAHEMIHMFDYCRNKLDFKNIDHLACTEIRAANLVHCSFMSAMIQGTASPFHIKKTHQDCVKNMATASIMGVRKVTEQEAKIAIEKVFPMCYNDLEPIGRRIRRNSLDISRAYMEAPLYGYIHDH